MNDTDHIKEVINALYKGAGINTSFTGQVNENVAKVLGDLLSDISSCTAALKWVPKPSGGPATIKWIVQNIGRSIITQFKDNMSISCARARILQYQTPLRLASLGI